MNYKTKVFHVYIMANKPRGALYTGVTGYLVRRVRQHKDGTGSFFVRKYKIFLLVWYESFQYILNAIKKEKQIKKWRRAWKIALVEKQNPEWRDLYEDLI